MSVLVTGSAGHLGEALMRHFKATGLSAIGLDIKASTYTDVVGSIADKALVRDLMREVSVVFNTATLHKPHVVTHGPCAFVETNVTGTLNLLEAAREAAVNRFVYTSTTSVFGDALRPPATEPAAWVTEAVEPIPKNIYGVTKRAAEDLCLLYSRKFGVNCAILRTSRFFPEDDDNKETRDQFDSLNAKVNELLYRRVELDDVVSAHCLAMDYVMSTTEEQRSASHRPMCASGESDLRTARMVDVCGIRSRLHQPTRPRGSWLGARVQLRAGDSLR